MKGVQDALSRLSGVKRVTVRLQENVVVAETDPGQPVLPVAIWKEIERVGFVPQNMELWVDGVLDGDSFAVGGKRWPLVKPGLSGGERRRAHVRVIDGGEDPPKVELME